MQKTIVEIIKVLWKITAVFLLITMLMGCADLSNTIRLQNSGSEEDDDSFPIEKTNLREFGSFYLEASIEPSISDSLQYFSFEKDKKISENYAESDIHFGLTQSSTPFLILSPSPLSKGVQIENHNGEDDAIYVTFNKNDCIDEKLHYSSGGHPIPFLNSKYCWITNSGNIVEFVVTDITKIIDEQITYRITIEYVIWRDE